MDLKKVMAGMISASMLFANAGVFAAENDLLVNGVTFYQLNEEGKVDTLYKSVDNGGDLVRYPWKVTDLQAGDIRISAEVENAKSETQTVSLFAALKETATGTVVDVVGGEKAEVLPGQKIELTADITVPEGVGYKLETYLWDSAEGLKPIQNKTLLTQGPTDLTFAFTEPYDRSTPSVNLTWNGKAEIESYDIYVEGECVANTSETSYTVALKPYTA